MDEFTSFHPKITANMIAVFCYIAESTDKVILTRDLPDALNLPQTTVNRLIRTMSDRSYIREDGFKLMRQTTHPSDERQRIVELTPKGHGLSNKIKEIMS